MVGIQQDLRSFVVAFVDRKAATTVVIFHADVRFGGHPDAVYLFEANILEAATDLLASK